VCRDEVLDALSAVGVTLKPELADIIIERSGTDGQGRVHYKDLLGLLA
jgi:Ca2+-binding EF-hand superfamily protein